MHAPHLPFESIARDGFAPGRLLRPLVQAFEHSVLPEALRINHPELLRALQPVPTGALHFLPLWLKSAVLCEDSGAWAAGLRDNPAFADYLRPLAEAVQCRPTHSAGLMVWTLRTPAPRSAGETHFVALCRHPDDATPFGQASATARCFTLEAGLAPDEALLCEWTRTGKHVQHAAVQRADEQAFTSWVCRQL